MLKTTKFCCKNTKKTFKLNILLNNAQSVQKYNATVPLFDTLPLYYCIVKTIF